MLAADIRPLDCPGVQRTYQQLLETEGKEAAQRYLRVVSGGLQQMPDPARPRHKRKRQEPRKPAPSRTAQCHVTPIKTWIDPSIKGTWVPPQNRQETEAEETTLTQPVSEETPVSHSNGTALAVEKPSVEISSRAHHLKRLGQARSQEAMERAEAALQELEAQEGPITQKMFIQISGLSSSWLHSHPDFQERLNNLKNQRKEHPPSRKAAAKPSGIAQEARSARMGRPLNSATFEQHLRQKREEVALKLAQLQPQVRFLEGQLAGIDEVFELLGVSKL